MDQENLTSSDRTSKETLYLNTHIRNQNSSFLRNDWKGLEDDWRPILSLSVWTWRFIKMKKNTIILHSPLVLVWWSSYSLFNKRCPQKRESILKYKDAHAYWSKAAASRLSNSLSLFLELSLSLNRRQTHRHTDASLSNSSACLSCKSLVTRIWCQMNPTVLWRWCGVCLCLFWPVVLFFFPPWFLWLLVLLLPPCFMVHTIKYKLNLFISIHLSF